MKKNMVFFPKVISINGIDGFLVTKATKRETGLPYDIFMECEAANRFNGIQPYVYAASNNWLYPISISRRPVLLDDIKHEINDFSKIFEWIEKNHVLLSLHWNCLIDDAQLHFALLEHHKMEMGKTWKDEIDLSEVKDYFRKNE